MTTITGQYQRMWLPCNECSGLELLNIAEETPISTGDFLPVTAWDDYSGAAFRAAVNLGAPLFRHNDLSSLALMKAKYPGHVDATFGTQTEPGDSCFGALMFSIDSTSVPGIVILEVGSDPSFLTIGKSGASVVASVMDNGLGSPDNPNVPGNDVAALTNANDGVRRIYGIVVLSERNLTVAGDHCKNTWARFEFSTAGAVVASDHGTTYSVGDSRLTTDGDAIDDKVDMVVQPIAGTLDVELFGWLHSYFPNGVRPRFNSSVILHTQAQQAFQNWGADIKTVPQEWLEFTGSSIGQTFVEQYQRRG